MSQIQEEIVSRISATGQQSSINTANFHDSHIRDLLINGCTMLNNVDFGNTRIRTNSIKNVPSSSYRKVNLEGSNLPKGVL